MLRVVGEPVLRNVTRWRLPLYFSPGILLIATYFGLMLFQEWTLASLPGGGAVKPLHVMGIAIILGTLASGVIPRLPLVVALFATLVIGSSVWFVRWGFSPILLNYLFSILTFIAVLKLTSAADQGRLLKAIQLVVVGFFSAVVLKAVLYSYEISTFLASPNGHPPVPAFMGGGLNIEASWLAITSALFLRNRLFHLPMALLAAAVSVLYASRVGLLLSVISLLFAALNTRSKRPDRIVTIGTLSLISVVAAIALLGDTYIFERFTAIGEDPGSVGRIRLWSAALQAFLNTPWGVGPGNGVLAAQAFSLVRLPEDNLHNVFLQWSVEFGVLGGVMYVLLVFRVLVFLKQTRFRDPIGAVLALYLVGSLLQFRGAEPLLWFFLAWMWTRLRSFGRITPRTAPT